MNITTLDIIDLLPYDLAARVQADEFFVDIPVVVAEEGNVEAEMNKRQAVVTTKTGKRGVAVIVLQMVADDEHAPQFGPLVLRPAFQIVENRELNRDANGTHKSGRKVARRLRDIFKNGYIQGMVANIQPDKPFIEPVNFAKEIGDQVKGYQVNFRCLEASTDNQGQVQLVQFVSIAPAAQFAMSCPTPNAQIYYTLDDSYPAAGNPDAIAYVTGNPVDIPVAPGTGTIGSVTVRAVAYVPGLVASWPVRKTIAAL